MKRTHFSNRGQALIIFVFALIGLVGMTGLAVDGTHILAERRHVQNAADTAAMAGALTKVNGQENNSWTNTSCRTWVGSPPAPPSPLPDCASAIITQAKNRAASNGYSGNITDSTVTVNVPPQSGPYSNCGSYAFDCEDYVEVIIETNIQTWFARVLGVPQTHNRVEAVALARYHQEEALFGGNALVVLDPHETSCDGEFQLSGTATVNLDGGGIWVNSDNTCAWKYTSGCATINLYNGASVKVVGNLNGGPQGCTPPFTIQHPTYQYPYPPDPILTPQQIPPAAACANGGSSYLGTDGNIHWRAGYYDKLPPDNDVILDPGVYCVRDVIKTTNPTFLRTLDQDPSTPGKQGGVFIYVMDGGEFDFQGGTVDLFAITDPNSPYWGILIYLDADYAGSHPKCTINGGADDHYTGIIYAPECIVTINGQSGTFGLTAQVVGYQMVVTGNNVLNVIYDPSQMPRKPEIRWTGLYH